MDKVVRFRQESRPPRVSVVIPTYNNAASLQRLLDALKASEPPAGGMEIVVVDDGSSDHTSEVVAAGAGVVYVWQPNAGTAAARDCGWRTARGEIVVFFDDDVVPEPDVVRLFDEALRDADGVGAKFRALREDSLIAHYQHADGLIDHRVVKDEVRWLITGAAAFRRSALEAVDGFDLGFVAAGEDVDLSMRMLNAGLKLIVEPRAIVRHEHRAQFKQLLETCYRYGMFSHNLAAYHKLYRRERLALALRRVNPVDLARMYRRYREDASPARALLFLALHQLVAAPYAIGLVRNRLEKSTPSAPSWRQAPAARATAAVTLSGIPAPNGATRVVASLEPAVELEASAV